MADNNSSVEVDVKFEVKSNSLGFPVIAPVGEGALNSRDELVADVVNMANKGREKTRLTKESGDRVANSLGKIGGPFERKENPSFLADRVSVYDEIMAAQKARLAAKPRVPIKITLPDGKTLDGTSWETTPLQIAESISKGLAASVVVAKVTYSSRVGIEDADGLSMVNTGPEEEGAVAAEQAELWDLIRPLEGDCKLALLKFDDKEGRMVFWHSSAHILGECLECGHGAKLCIGPPTEEGFYYDAYVGQHGFSDADFPAIKKRAEEIAKQKQQFERIVLTKEEALRLFADNPFKVQLISTKIPDGSYTTAYRCGPLIDLCRGPHVPTTASVKAFEVMKVSAAYWLGNAANDSLQRVYGVSFPDSKQMKEHLYMLEEAKKRDHRVVGTAQELFFFHDLSPGSAFFLPHGARIYNRLMEYIRKQYRRRGFEEVITPNMFNLDLWRISGHADHYLENMFTFKVEGLDFGLKPMNCPGHCLLFDHRVRSYRELPMRLADFGVLHRNEFSGALTGLTRVRRFQQDDAHIFCRPDQIKQEVAGALEFMKHTYGVFGFKFELDLSTRPEKALGSQALWDSAEAMMTDALNAFGEPWKLNPGDGAFYGPKIDIKVFDALGRRHQCATVQLDFQLPIRFDLRYRAADQEVANDGSTTAATASEADKATAGVAALSIESKPDEASTPSSVATSSTELSVEQLREQRKREKEAKKAAAKAKIEAAQQQNHIVSPAEAEQNPHLPQATSAMQHMVERARSGVDIVPEGYERPVIIHRAIYGSLERFMAVLIEHTGGKWPLWISPRQVAIVPVSHKFVEYAQKVADALHANDIFVSIDTSGSTLNKKVREAQVAQFNYILVVGAQEEAEGSVNIRTRDNVQHGTKPLDQFIADLKAAIERYE